MSQSEPQTSWIDLLLDLTRRLQMLLNDPHPGLFTWNEAVNDVIKKIGEFR